MITTLSDDERKALVASLERAQARVKAGEAINYDPKAFKDRLIVIYRSSARS